MVQHCIPIRFIDRHGNASRADADVRIAIPVFDVAICTPSWRGESDIHLGVALVDTGADLNHVRQSAIDRAALQPNFKSVTETAHGEMPTTVYHGGLYFPHAQLVVSTEVSSDPLHNRPYDIIVGRLTLQLGCLVLDYPSNTFEWRIEVR